MEEVQRSLKKNNGVKKRLKEINIAKKVKIFQNIFLMPTILSWTVYIVPELAIWTMANGNKKLTYELIG